MGQPLHACSHSSPVRQRHAVHDGTAGLPAVQRMGVRQGCPLSATLFGIFFFKELQVAALGGGLLGGWCLL